jgi:hypothetical protein
MGGDFALIQVSGLDHVGVQRLRDAALGGRPDTEAITIMAAANEGAPVERWLAAVALGGQGWYASAAALLGELINGRDEVIAALAGSTLASHLRQMGGHAAAKRVDASALRRLAVLGRPAGDEVDPAGVDLAGAWSDALLGLAADAVGLGRLGEARRLADAASRLDTGAWRPAVRLGWVRAEISLAAGRPGDAVSPAERAAELAATSGSLRHQVKSAMVLAAALTADSTECVPTAGGTPDGRSRADGLLTEALVTSLDRGMFPLAWPCALLLAQLFPERARRYTSVAGDALTCVFARADGPTRRIAAASPWVPTALIRSGEPTRTGAWLAT